MVETLDAAGVEYMVTGSVVSSLQGEPRATHDLDLVVRMTPASVALLAEAFPPPEFYLDEQTAREAVASGGMFNLIAIHEGDMVDFWMLGNHPFDRSSFARRQVEHVFDIVLRVSTPEDTILQKLRWAKLSGGSEKHVQDALRVYEVQGATLDLDYVNRWAHQLTVRDLWERIQRDAELV